MSIAIVAHYLGPSLGIGQYITRLLPPLAEELIKLKADFRFLVSPNALQQTPVLGEFKNYVNILPALDYPPSKRYLWVATHLKRYCYQEDIKNVTWLSNPMVLPWHPPSIAVIHDVNEWKVKNKYGNSLRTALRGFIYLEASIRFAKKIIVVSKSTEKDILFFCPQQHLRQKLLTIPNGMDSPLTSLSSVPISAPTNPFLLSVGRIDPSAKCLPDAVALVSALRELTKESWELHLIGGMNASTQASAELFLRSIQNLPWVHYHGYVEDSALAQWYRAATAVVFLSENEGFGLPIAEGLSFGRWVIVNQANPTIMEFGNNGILPIDPKTPAQAASILLRHIEKIKSPLSCNLVSQWRTAAIRYAEEIYAMYNI